MKLPLIAAHMGCFTGNVPANSQLAYEAALMAGADIVEIDVTKSMDGELFVFHPGLEHRWLLSDRRITSMTAAEVDQLRFTNVGGGLTEHRVARLDDVMEQLKGRCLINVDKFFDHPAEIGALIRRHSMQDQVIVKTKAGEEWFRIVEEVAADLPYMAITSSSDDFSETLLKRNLRYIGTEALFTTDDEPVAQKSYIERMHDLGLKVWYNAILYNYKVLLAARHSDDVAVSGDPDSSWGWLIRQGVDMIQTDWTPMLRHYMHHCFKP